MTPSKVLVSSAGIDVQQAWKAMSRLLLCLGWVGLVAFGPSACGSNNASSFSLSWRLVDANQADPMTAPALSCADANITTIRLVLAAQGNPAQPIQVDLDCTPGNGVTAPVREDAYSIQALALGPAGSAAQTAFDESNVGGAKDLGLIIFQIKR